MGFISDSISGTTISGGSFNDLNLGLGAGSISTNIAIGSGTLSSNTYGTYNTALGSDALKNNTTGNYNVALGYSALKYFQSSGNVAFGQNALKGQKIYNNYTYTYDYSTGANNVALGPSALQNNTTGTDNIALGRDALASNTTGAYNTGLGYGVQSGDYSGSLILGAGAAAAANGQLALGSVSYPLGPVATESLTSNKTLEINLNGNLYKVLMYQP